MSQFFSKFSSIYFFPIFSLDKDLTHFCRILDREFRQTLPRKTVHFLFDGVAPVAKFLEQKIRRSGKKSRGVQNAITPGTIFMRELSQAMQYYIARRFTTFKFRGIEFFLSGMKNHDHHKIHTWLALNFFVLRIFFFLF